MVAWNKGLTKETDIRVKKYSESLVGNIAWNKGLNKNLHVGIKNQSEKIKGNRFGALVKNRRCLFQKGHIPWCKGKHLSEEIKQKISDKLSNKYLSGELIGYWKGKKQPHVALRNKNYPLKKEKNPAWKGGITPIVHAIRASDEYAKWRTQIFIKDSYACQKCSSKLDLHAHHIIPISSNITKALDLENGMTLCVDCHQKEHPKIKINKNAVLKLNKNKLKGVLS